MTTGTFESLHAELPKRKEIAEYLDTLFFECNRDKSFHISQIVVDVKQFFNVSDEAAALRLEDGGRTGHLNTGTYLESLTHFSVWDLYELHQVKRVNGNTWISVHGAVGELSKKPRVSKRLVAEAEMSIKILQGIGHTIEQIKDECQAKWDMKVILVAIEHVFGEQVPA